MATFKTKYPNNSREVSGTPTIFADDVSLLCRTSLGAVTINLLEIPDNHWNTLYKLYITDLDNNAATNNITINAGIGQTINNQASYTISTNNGGVVVRILSNGEFIVLDSVTSASSGYDQIQDEGVNLTKRTILNFIGSGVSAVDDPGNLRTNVTISGLGIIDITHANLLALSVAGTIVEGQLYRVTDPTYAYNLIVTGISSTEVSVDCKAKWLVTDYQGVGNYTTVPSFNTTLGVWNTTLAVVLGDVCIWNNTHYVNISGVNATTTPDVDAANWTVLAKTITNGFVLEVEFGIYDFANNLITRRFDQRFNDIEYNADKGVLLWQWFPFGSNKVSYNRFIGSATSCVGIANGLGGISSKIKDNVVRGTILSTYLPSANANILVEDNSVGKNGTLAFGGRIANSMTFKSNVIEGNLRIVGIGFTTVNVNVQFNQIFPGASFQISTFSGAFSLTVNANVAQNSASLIISNIIATADVAIENNIHQNGSITIATLRSPATWSGNKINFPTAIAENLGTLQDNTSQGGFNSVVQNTVVSTLRKTLDMTNASDYNPGTQTLLLGTNRIIGEYRITNATGNTITKINGGPYETPFKIIMANAAPTAPAVLLNNTSMAVATTDDLVFNSSLTSNLQLDMFAVSGESTTFSRGNGTGAPTGPQFVIEQQTFA